MEKFKKEESFGLIPTFKKGKETLFLLILRNEGFWEFPKGHKKEGESGLETARREFEEETGIKDYEVVNVSEVFEEKYFYEKNGERIEKTVKFFLAETDTQDVKLQESEIKDAKWLNFKDAKELLTYKETKDLLERVNKEIIRKENFKIPKSFFIKLVFAIAFPLFLTILGLFLYFN